MTDDSRPPAVGLAQAVLDWINPVLLDAVRAAEAQCDLDELERLLRDPIARILDRRARPQRGRVIQLGGRPPEIAAWDRAWDAVINALRLKVESGDLILTGRMIRPDTRTEAEPIPSAWATELDFDPRGSAVFVRDATYVNVMCRRSAVGCVPGHAPADSATCPTELPLREGVLQWCDPWLARGVLRAEEPKDRPLIVSDYDPLDPSVGDPPQEVPGRTVAGAWATIEQDFRRRLELEELFLTAVPIDPDIAPLAVTLPSAWAYALSFDFMRGLLQLGPRTFGQVRVRRTRLIAAQSPLVGPNGTDEMTLGEAVSALTDSGLRRAVRYAERPFSREVLHRPPRVHLGGGEGRADRRFLAGDLRQSLAQLDRAWRALERDFRDRVESGAILLRGVQTAPEASTDRVVIPGVWASDLSFDFLASTVTGVGRRYVSVRCSGPSMPGIAREADAAPEPPLVEARGAEVTSPGKQGEITTDMEVPVPPPRPRGRPAFPESAMLAIVEERLRRGQRAPTNKVEANLLLAAFRDAHPGVQAPAFATVLTHVGDLYKAAAARAATRKSRKT